MSGSVAESLESIFLQPASLRHLLNLWDVVEIFNQARQPTTKRRHCQACCAAYWSHPIKTLVKKENIFIIASLKRFRSPKKKTSPVVIELATQPCGLSKILPGSKRSLDPSKHTRTSSVPWNSKLEHDISQITHTGRRHWMLRTFQRLVHQHRRAILREFSQQKASFCTEKSYLWERRKNSTRLSLFQIIALFGCWDGDVSREARGKLSKKRIKFHFEKLARRRIKGTKRKRIIISSW